MEEIKKHGSGSLFKPYGRTCQVCGNAAVSFNAELILVNINNEWDIEIVKKIAPYGYKVDEEHYIQEIESDRTKDLDAVLQNVDFPADRVRRVFKVGQPANALLKLTIEEDVDMIVMGIRDKTDLFHTLTGWVTDKVFRRSPVTIVSFRDKKHAGHLRKRLLG